MKAILKYPGAKWRISDWIIAHFPPHRVYLEPYFGSGAVFFRKTPAYIETINDLDGNIVNLFRVCREHQNELAALIAATPFARDEFQACYEKSDSPIEQARRTLVRYHQSFGSCNRTKNSWKNTQKASGPRCATMWNYLPQTIIDCGDRLKEAQIENRNAVELIKRYNDPNTLIYCDPPYLTSVRKRGLYAVEMTENQHLELLRAIKQSKSKIVISGYDSELYNDMLSDWSTDEIETTAQMGLHRTEKIWMNYAQNPTLWDRN